MYNNQIQFPVDQFITPRVQINPQNPPLVFQIQCAPWLTPYVPYITGVFMDMITMEAVGPVTIHFYNHMSQNNWNNRAFADEIANLADFIFLEDGGRQDPRPLAQYIGAYYGLRSKFEVQLFGGLRGFIQPQDQYVFDQAIQQFNGIANRIAQVRSGVPPQQMAPMQPQMGQQYMPPMQQQSAPVYTGMGQMAGGYQPQATGYQVPGMPMQPRASGAGRDYGGGGGAAVPQTPPQPQPQPMPVQPMQPQPAPQATAPAPAPAQPVPGQIRVEDLRDPETTPWNPEPTISPILYNPVKIKMMYLIDANGHTTSQPVKTNMDPINYDRHVISTLFGRPPEKMPLVLDNTEIATEIKQGALQALEETQEVNEEGERVSEHLGLRNILSAFTFEEAVMDVRTEMEAKIDRDNRPMVFQGYAQIFTTIMGDKSEYDLIDKLKDSNSYVELREKLIAAGATASPALITDISIKLTNLMNDILRNRLSIQPSEIEVEDFVTDLDPLLNALKNNYGENGDRLYRAFIKDQALRIQAMFAAPDMSTESGQALHDSLMSTRLTLSWEGRDDLPGFTFFGPTVRFTFIDVISHDLILQGMPGLGNVITKQHTQILQDLAASLFEVKPGEMLVDRQYVVTKDGRIMEITQSLFIENVFMMNLVK